MGLLHNLEDVGEDIVRITKNATFGHYVLDDFKGLASRIDDMKEAIQKEILNNRIASDSQHGWWTVKCYEANPLFTGANAEEETKKLYTAQMRAGREIRRIRPYAGKGQYKNKGGRGGFQDRGGFNGGGESFRGNFNGGAGGSGANRGNFGRGGGNFAKPAMMCFTCHNPGHSYVNCPDKNK